MIEKLEQEVVEWAEQKGIFEKSYPQAQMHKMMEEVDELFDEVDTHEVDVFNLDKIKGELGDVLVTCVIQAKFHDLSLQSCLQKALTKITKRTGRMVDGQFVKDIH